MTITSEELRDCAEMASLTSERVSCLSPEHLTKIADHIDAQDMKIECMEEKLKARKEGIDGLRGALDEANKIIAWQRDEKPDLKLIDAQAARISELENDELRQRLANAEHQLYMKDLAIHNIKASRRAQFRKRQAAEKELSALADIAGSNAARVKELERELATSEPFGWLRVVSGRSFQIMEGGQRPPDRSGDCVGPWFAVYTQPVPVAVPDKKTIPDVYMATYHENIGWNACIDEVLRLNSGSMSDEH